MNKTIKVKSNLLETGEIGGQKLTSEMVEQVRQMLPGVTVFWKNPLVENVAGVVDSLDDNSIIVRVLDNQDTLSGEYVGNIQLSVYNMPNGDIEKVHKIYSVSLVRSLKDE